MKKQQPVKEINNMFNEGHLMFNEGHPIFNEGYPMFNEGQTMFRENPIITAQLLNIGKNSDNNIIQQLVTVNQKNQEYTFRIYINNQVIQFTAKSTTNV